MIKFERWWHWQWHFIQDQKPVRALGGPEQQAELPGGGSPSPSPSMFTINIMINIISQIYNYQHRHQHQHNNKQSEHQQNDYHDKHASQYQFLNQHQCQNQYQHNINYPNQVSLKTEIIKQKQEMINCLQDELIKVIMIMIQTLKIRIIIMMKMINSWIVARGLSAAAKLANYHHN